MSHRQPLWFHVKLETFILGYHRYKIVYIPFIGEELLGDITCNQQVLWISTPLLFGEIMDLPLEVRKIFRDKIFLLKIS